MTTDRLKRAGLARLCVGPGGSRAVASGFRLEFNFGPEVLITVRAIKTLPGIRNATGLSFPAVSSAMDLLVELGIARELTGKRRNRLFVYDRYLSTLNEGTESV
jgi:hypothetical protein